MQSNQKEAKFSYFKKGVTSTAPFAEVAIEFVVDLIRSFKLKEITQKIREGKADKTKVLPSVTFSGTFASRCKAGLKEWSSYICLDVDELDFASTLKYRVSIDVFLNAVLLFISTRGHGLKIVVRVKDGVPEQHRLYFEALSLYLKTVFGIEVDASGSDESRLCFLCHDEAVYYNPNGFVTADALQRLLPKTATDSCNSSKIRESKIGVSQIPKIKTTAAQRNLPPAGPSAENDEKPSTRLNKLPEIHELAVKALERSGWKPSGDLKGERITRPYKAVKDGCSAIYNLYEKEGIWIMTVFSNNAFPFKAHKGYSDVQIICLLDYADDWTACISDLASRYLEPV